METFPPGGSPPSDTAPPEGVRPPLERVPWHWWEPVVVFLLIFLTSGLIGSLIFAVYGGEVSDAALSRIAVTDPARAAELADRNDVQKVLSVLGFEIAMMLWVLAWPYLRFKRGVGILGLTKERLGRALHSGLAWGIAGWAVAAVGVGWLTTVIVERVRDKPVPQPDQLGFGDSPSALVLGLAASGVVLIAPVAEELFFRGFVHQAFRRYFAFPLAGLISGVLFMGAHAPFFIIFPSIFVLGVLLAWLFEHERSIVPSIVAHAVFNGIGFIVYLTTLD